MSTVQQKAFLTETEISSRLLEPYPEPPGFDSYEGLGRGRVLRQKCLGRLIAAFSLLLVSLLLLLWAQSNPEGVANIYRPAARTVSYIYGSVFSIFKVSLFEIIFALLLLGVLATLGLAVWRGVRLKMPLAYLARWASGVFLTASIMVFMFFSLWGLNYRAQPLADTFGIETRPPESQELAEVTLWLREGIIELSDTLPRDANGVLLDADFGTLSLEALNAFSLLGKTYPVFDGAVHMPNILLTGDIFGKFNVAGIYMPLTAEANVSGDITAAYMPFTVCHELAHSYGIAPEDEANFSAALACLGSPDDRVRYSGCLVTYAYCVSALSAADPELAAQIAAKGLPSGAVADLNAYREYVDTLRGPLFDAGSDINDSYLKTMGEQDGIAGYGLMVDLVVAWIYPQISSGVL